MAIIDVVKYNGGPEVFAWKYPSQELSTWTQLIVNESQEAVLYSEGQAMDVFTSGRYVLDTANIPILSSFFKIPFGGQTPFPAEVWYVNKAHILDVKWGTPTPIQVQDPKYGVFVSVRAHGMFGIHITDTRKFLIKLVGTVPVFDKNSLIKYFRGLYVARVKDIISTYLVQNQISIMEINAYTDEISDEMCQTLKPELAEYGMELVNFFVNDISVPEDDPTVRTLKNALAKRAEMDIIGYNYQQQRSFDTLESAAKNEGSSAATFMGAGMGFGIGTGMGGAVGQQMNSIAGVMNTGRTENAGGNSYSMPENGSACSNCGRKMLPGQKFCPECGTPAVRRCPNCQNEIKGNAKFCPECGCKL